MPSPSFSPSERKILGVLSIVQFVNVLDFMIVMPLGPDMGRALGVSMDQMGWIGGSFTFAAFISGIAGSFYLDRLKRKQSLLFHLTGLALATWSSTLATDLTTLLAARVLAGFFGGPVSSTLLAIISDVIRPENRGRALGLVMGAFSFASILGVPVGLELARIGGWRLPFVAVGALALLTVLACSIWLPSFEGYRKAEGSQNLIASDSLFSKGVVPISLFLGANGVLATFLIIPNLSAYLQFNLGFARDNLGMLYLGGGVLSLLSTRLGGIWNDRVGTLTPVVAATVLYTGVVVSGMMLDPPWIPTVVFFSLLMLANSLRWISISTLTSKVPSPRHRARYMSLLSAAQHLASSSGAFLSTQLLTSNADGSLSGVPRLAGVSIAITLMVPPVVALVERLLTRAPSSSKAL